MKVDDCKGCLNFVCRYGDPEYQYCLTLSDTIEKIKSCNYKQEEK